MVVVLPEPLTPATRMTNGFFAVSIASGCATGASVFSISAATTALTSSGEIPAVVAAVAERGGDAARGVEPEIGADQHVLDLGDGCGIELALGDEIGDGAAERRRRALEPAGQAPPPIAFCFCHAVVHAAPVIAVSPR